MSLLAVALSLQLLALGEAAASPSVPPPPSVGQPANSGGQAFTPPAETGRFLAAAEVPEPVGSRTDFQLSASTLELLRKKGILSEKEYREALEDLIEVGSRAKREPTVVLGHFAATMYGFVEADSIHDSTRSFVDLAGMGAIGQPGTVGGDNGRTMFGVRNSRLGFHLQAPETNGIRTSGLLEMDFLGNQPGTPPKPAFGEAPFWNNPTFRVRHFILKADTDYLSLWFGQTWELVGWQGAFQPNTVAIQGVPGELYARTPQIRAVHAFKVGPTTLEVAVAALRPPQMDDEMPDLQGGLKWSIDGWKGVQTIGATGTAITPAAVGLSGGLRQYKLLTGASPDAFTTAEGHVVAADILLPILPAKTRKSWALTFLGEATSGTGDADLFTGLTGNAAVGAPTGYTGGSKAYAALADIDPGLAGFNPSGSLETIDWRTLMVSAQLYLPPEGNLWIAGSYSNTYSDNISDFGSASSVWSHEIWWDLNLFADVTPSTRLGLEYSHFTQTYVNGVQAPDTRVQLSAFYIF